MTTKRTKRSNERRRTGRRLTLQTILLQHWQSFADEYPQPRFVRRAAYLLAHCRTAVLGGHVKRCEHGHLEAVYYNSCRHRVCPGCSSGPRATWLARWQAKMLDTPAHHVVFTVPQELVPLWRMNKRRFTNELFSAAKESLMTLLADPQFMGATPGLLGALHTWSQTLAAHPHVHFIVTSGGLAKDGSWKTAKKDCLLPPRVLMHMFRGKLLARLRALVEQSACTLPSETTQARCLSLLNRLGRATWNVRLLERYDHAAGVAIYLAKYLRGGPIGNHRLLSVRDGQVTFRYLDRRDGKSPRHAKRKLPVNKFLQLWAQHVPPAGMHTVRAYGLYASGSTARLNEARLQLSQTPYHPEQPIAPQQAELKSHSPVIANSACPSLCPTCGAQLKCEPLPRDNDIRPWHVLPPSPSVVKPSRGPPPSRSATDAPQESAA